MAKKVKIKGTIIPNNYKEIYEFFGMEATAPKDIDDVIENAEGDDLDVEINSGGGDVFSGSEIYTALKSYPGKVNVKILGIAASAASVIAMAGNHISIAPTAQIMIHNVRSRAAGDYRDLQHEANVLENWNKSIANAYILKTGMSQDELLDLMDKETWLNAKQAKDYGFADEILFDDGNQLVASHTNSYLLPPEVVNKISNLINASTKNEIYETRLQFLKLKGEFKNEIR